MAKRLGKVILPVHDEDFDLRVLPSCPAPIPSLGKKYVHKLEHLHQDDAFDMVMASLETSMRLRPRTASPSFKGQRAADSRQG